ncbi:Dynamin-2A [Zea mays]|uniref:dynamin GTPase n=1 Tax=Zea mays TaxID=4577 RepID=A0A1D6HJQ6_MAIZE|nr:Dynamin-2A [Zea mays]
MSSSAAMEAIDELVQLSESMRQAASLLADDDPSDETASRRPSTFLNAVALGNVGAGKSAVLNSLIGHPVLPTGENGATRAPIVVDLARDPGLSSKSIVLQIDSKSQQVSASALRHSLQDRLSKGASSGSGRSRSDEIYLKLRTSTAPPLKLIDLPGIDQRVMDDSTISEYAGHNDALLIVVIPAMQAADVASSRALRLAKDIDPDGTRTIGVLSKIDQAAADAKTIVLEADGYQPYLISPEKGLRSLIKGVLEMAKEPSRLCVEEVHRVLLDIVNAAANATPGLGRYPPFKREVIAIASNALDAFKSDAKKMVVALVDMERAFVPPQHFIRLVQRRMERQRREDELKNNRSSKKGQDAELSKMNRASSPQTGSDEAGGNLKSMKDKSNKQDNDTKEGPNLQVAGPGGEITAGYLLKKSAKNNEWSKRWFVLNEKSGKLGYTKKQEERHFRGVIVLEECNLEEIEEEEISKSSKDSKKANGQEKGPSLVFKITNRVSYKTVLKAHSAVILKAESMADKIEWIKKIKGVIQSRGGSVKGPTEDGPMRQSRSDGSLDTMARRPADPEEELRWMSQEVRGYVEAVLNSLAANVPKAIVLCQVEKSKEDMLNKLYNSISAQSNAKIEELLQEDHNAKRRREKYQKQSSLLSKLTRQLSIHDNRAASYGNDSSGAEGSPRSPGHSGEDWKSAFDSATNGSVDRSSSQHETRSKSADSRGRRHENGDANSGSRRTPNRLPPAPPNGGRY